MQLASSARIPDGFMAAMRLGGEKPHQGLPGRNPALYQGPTVCNSTTALGLRGQAELNRVGSCSTGKERDTESGNDYFGKRYYASSMGRWMSPDIINVTEERMMNPANTLNKYAYAADNPLKFIDPDGQDVTYFYDPGGLAGHAVLFAYNQANGDSAIESFGPKVHSPIWAGTGNFDMDEFHSAQGVRDNYASVTMQTTPEVAQQVIDFIRANPDPSTWTMLGPNCSSEVQKILAKFKLGNTRHGGRE